MAFSSESYQAVKNIITNRRLDAEAKARERLADAYRKCPELKELDAVFPEIAGKIIEAFSDNKNPDKTVSTIRKLQKESENLMAQRAELLKMAGLPADYTDPHYHCEKCKDTGYLPHGKCECLKKELVLYGYAHSGLGCLLEKQDFDNFSLDYYYGNDRLLMEENLSRCKNFADGFPSSVSLLMIGNTGLGKTHLSTSIAKAVIGRGYDVLYETSQNLISAFSSERFGKNYGVSNEVSDTERFFSCDLLIIDDFGTEETNQFSVSVFYNLINSRTNKALSTIINTNLSQSDLKNRYGDRITSRLLGEFTVLSFPGKDIRMQKLIR